MSTELSPSSAGSTGARTTAGYPVLLIGAKPSTTAGADDRRPAVVGRGSPAIASIDVAAATGHVRSDDVLTLARR
jgi:hypothetical protein